MQCIDSTIAPTGEPSAWAYLSRPSRGIWAYLFPVQGGTRRTLRRALRVLRANSLPGTGGDCFSQFSDTGIAPYCDGILIPSSDDPGTRGLLPGNSRLRNRNWKATCQETLLAAA